MIPDKNNFFDDFTEIFNLKSLLTEPLWFKFENQTTMGLILNNHEICLEAGISDHHKIIFSILKHAFFKGSFKTVYY